METTGGTIIKQVLLVVCFLLILSGTAEFILQFMHLSSLVASDQGFFINPDRLRQVQVSRKIDDPVLGALPNPEFYEHDKLGFRNAQVPDPGAVRLVAIGDSQTYGAGVHRPEAWPQQLKALGISTYNLAFGGFGPAHYAHFMNRALAFRPELVVVAFYSGNDLYDTYNLVYLRHRMPELAVSDPDTLKSLEAARKKDNVLQKDRPPLEISFAPGGSMTWLKNKSKLYEVWTRVHRSLKHNQAEDPCYRNLRMEEVAAVKDAAPTILTPDYRFPAVNLSDPRIREGLDSSLKAFRWMAHRAQQQRVQFMVMLIPTKELVYAPILEAGANPPHPALQKQVHWEREVFSRIKKDLDRAGIPYVSVLPALQEALSLNQAPYLPNANGHPTAVGHQAIAQCVYHFIGERFPQIATE